MKVFILLLFVFTFPVVLWLTAVFYGGFSSTVLKDELVKAHVYSKMGTYIADLSAGSDETNNDIQYTKILQNRFTPSYLQEKSEEIIDVSSDWITEAKTTSPIISFREIKQDMLSQYPQLLPELEAYASQAKAQQASDDWSGEDIEQTTHMAEGLDSLKSLAKSDFSIDMSTYLAPLKSGYSFLRILLPVLAILLLLYLGLLLYLNNSWASRFRWVGATFFISGIWGFIAIFISGTLVQLSSQLMLSTNNPVLFIITPIYHTLISYFHFVYMNYQGISAVALLLLAGVCLGIVAMTKPSVSSSIPKGQKTKK